jgi:hypothetical protein
MKNWSVVIADRRVTGSRGIGQAIAQKLASEGLKWW